MAVIRANQVPAAAKAFSMTDVEEAARRVLLKAKLQAENLIAAAMEEAEQLKEQARQDGSKEGFDHGHAEGVRHGTEAGRQQALQQQSAEVATLMQTLTAALTEIETYRQTIESDARREVVQFALAVARRVVKRQAAVDPDVLEANLSEAMKLAVGAAEIRIAIHPSQRSAVQELLPKLKLTWPDLKHIDLTDDAGISVGGCKLFTRSGSIDADLKSQLDRVIAELLPDADSAGADDPIDFTAGDKGTTGVSAPGGAA